MSQSKLTSACAPSGRTGHVPSFHASKCKLEGRGRTSRKIRSATGCAVTYEPPTEHHGLGCATEVGCELPQSLQTPRCYRLQLKLEG